MKNKNELENKIQYLPIGMCIGLSVGMAIGAAMDNISTGMCLGMGIGLCFGFAMDAQNRKKINDKEKKDS